VFRNQVLGVNSGVCVVEFCLSTSDVLIEWGRMPAKIPLWRRVDGRPITIKQRTSMGALWP